MNPSAEGLRAAEGLMAVIAKDVMVQQVLLTTAVGTGMVDPEILLNMLRETGRYLSLTYPELDFTPQALTAVLAYLALDMGFQVPSAKRSRLN